MGGYNAINFSRTLNEKIINIRDKISTKTTYKPPNIPNCLIPIVYDNALLQCKTKCYRKYGPLLKLMKTRKQRNYLFDQLTKFGRRAMTILDPYGIFMHYHNDEKGLEPNWNEPASDEEDDKEEKEEIIEISTSNKNKPELIPKFIINAAKNTFSNIFMKKPPPEESSLQPQSESEISQQIYGEKKPKTYKHKKNELGISSFWIPKDEKRESKPTSKIPPRGYDDFYNDEDDSDYDDPLSLSQSRHELYDAVNTPSEYSDPKFAVNPLLKGTKNKKK